MNKEETFIDDLKIPAETRVCFSVVKGILAQPFYILMIVAGAFAIVRKQGVSVKNSDILHQISGVLFCITGIMLTWRNSRQLLNRAPQIIISDGGLWLAGHPFHSWAVISDLHIVPRGTGVRIRYFLQYNANGMFDIEDSFNISHRRRLQLHRSRFMACQLEPSNKVARR
ncbi:hypothetical protein [Mucilaginibacter sp.]|uniref:hypothetical protein n=1 Tax=Mucilaginibacter sp. TaxID=1882438 RepID=UPI0035BBD3B6